MSQPIKNGLFMFLFFMAACLTIIPQMEARTPKAERGLRSILKHFKRTRNDDVSPAAKQRARDFILKSFKERGLHTWIQDFPSNNDKYPGVNVVGQLPGRYTGTPDDKMVLICAHYDTFKTTPGVDDNGSGITALLQALKLFTRRGNQSCSRDYTLQFVAFNLNGSNVFVQNLTQYLNTTGAGFQGAIILETILNYNTTPNSQILTLGLDQVFPQQYQEISQNQFRGDFLALIGRAQDDGHLISGITNSYKENDTFKSIAVPMALPGRPSDWPVSYLSAVRVLVSTEQYNFWNAEPSLPAVVLTDTAQARGYMQQCYHQQCDDIHHVTPEMMTFLGRTADSLVEVATIMTNEKCQMKEM